MLHHTKGIVLKVTRFKESSAIVQIYTEVFGQKTYIVNGLFSKTAKNKAAYFQALSLLDLVVYNKPNSNINRVKEQKWAFMFTDIPFNFYKRTLAQVINEVILKCVKEEEDNQKLFNFLFESIKNLDDEKDTKDFLIYFLLQLSIYLGFEPYNNFSEKNTLFDLQQGLYVPAFASNITTLDVWKSELLAKYLSNNRLEANRINIDRKERKVLIESILKYYGLQVTNFTNLKSMDVLSMMFDDLA